MENKAFNKYVKNSNIKFDNKFDYSKFEYINAKTKSIIVCPIHGEFYQNFDKHLNSTFGCQNCAFKLKTSGIKPLRGSSKESLDKNLKLMEDKLKKSCISYDFIYKNPDRILIKEVTVAFKCKCGNDYKKSYYACAISPLISCNICDNKRRSLGKTKSFENVIIECNEKYNNMYTYSQIETYKTKKSKINIHCKIHGIFVKTVDKHLMGQICPKCNLQNNIELGKYPGGYNETFFENYPEKVNDVCFIYFVKIKNFYKIGITKDLNKRLKGLKSEFKSEIIIEDFHETTLLKAYNLEQKILKDYDEYRFYTKTSTELFKINILKDTPLSESLNI